MHDWSAQNCKFSLISLRVGHRCLPATTWFELILTVVEGISVSLRHRMTQTRSALLGVVSTCVWVMSEMRCHGLARLLSLYTRTILITYQGFSCFAIRGILARKDVLLFLGQLRLFLTLVNEVRRLLLEVVVLICHLHLRYFIWVVSIDFL